MLSRVADSLYWMARYVERAENIARFIDVNLQLTAEIPVEQQQWAPLIYASGDQDGYKEKYGKTFKQADVIDYLTFDPENPNSIMNCLRRARENARSIREIISSDLWLVLNKGYLGLRMSDAVKKAKDNPAQFFESIKQLSHLFCGASQTTMSHGEGFNFMRLGAAIERADKTSRILDVKYYILLPNVADVGTPLDNLQWAAVLKSASAWEEYRKRYRQITPKNVADFLVNDPTFPRSIHHCLIEAEHCVHQISGTRIGTFQNNAERELGRLRSELDYTTVDDILNRGLHEYVDDLQTRLNQVDKAVYDTFFSLETV